MKDKQLLSVMFSDAAEFREQLLNETLERVRRKRRIRRGGQALLALAIVAAAMWWSIPRPGTLESPAPAGVALQTIHTQPLPAEYILRTRLDSVTVVASDKSSVALIEDERLLDLVPGEMKLLVWHAPHQAELVIVGP